MDESPKNTNHRVQQCSNMEEQCTLSLRLAKGLEEVEVHKSLSTKFAAINECLIALGGDSSGHSTKGSHVPLSIDRMQRHMVPPFRLLMVVKCKTLEPP